MRITPKTYLRAPVTKPLENGVIRGENRVCYYQRNANEKAVLLLIKFSEKEETLMIPETEYVIVSDIDNTIAYDEVRHYEVHRDVVAERRARLEALKAQRTDIDNEIAELEGLIEQDEHIIKLADDKKAMEAMAASEQEVVTQVNE